MNLNEAVRREIGRLERTKTFKKETVIESEQGAVVRVAGKDAVMLASNNYLGLASDPRIKQAAIRGVRDYGYGVSSVRFLCGTLTVHRQLEEKIAGFLGTEDAVLFSSCFAANEGFFASIINEKMDAESYRDVIYSDRLNHASIIDGTRLCRAEVVDRKIYEHADVNDLQKKLEADREASYRFGFIATDGVFSMEGDLAPLPALIEISKKYGRILFADDSHAVGVIGATGRGSPEQLGVHGKVDVLSGTLGKALGGASGGYIAGNRDLISYLRQKSRPYTFSNSLPPSIAVAAIEAFTILEQDPSLIERLRQNTAYFRKHIQELGYKILAGEHPIVPVMLGEASVAMDMSEALLEEGVYIKGLWYPVVPKGEARLRAQISAAFDQATLDRALTAFEKVGKRLGVI
ncbi:MAG: glycine C-acetyltransferase [Acidobacteria bacterium 13_1_20CM_2_55_15]|nr:MAG: glycine C-acetyltransferase [Acidobacteria bacterium 13_1_40CM_56_16]OLD67768.1 MAG: glycine C-acetyltransferase [Acidobacteria bacterium 13_1_40CM_2_56_11]OLE89940.1 MAG: glycine C-acetyltransferase [Acidobacteria bacterium 13_1_20CM_2_55_15]